MTAYPWAAPARTKKGECNQQPPACPGQDRRAACVPPRLAKCNGKWLPTRREIDSGTERLIMKAVFIMSPDNDRRFLWAAGPSETSQEVTEPGRSPYLSSRRKTMNLSAPKQVTFWIAVVLAVLGILATLVTIPVLSGFAFWLVVIGFVVLAIGNLAEGI